MATETFDICAEFPATRTSWRPAESTPDGSPIVFSRDIVERELRTYKIEWKNAPRQIISRIKKLWATVYGPVVAMNFTPPDESAIEVRFLRGSLKYKIENAVAVSLQVEFEENR